MSDSVAEKAHGKATWHLSEQNVNVPCLYEEDVRCAGQCALWSQTSLKCGRSRGCDQTCPQCWLHCRFALPALPLVTPCLGCKEQQHRPPAPILALLWPLIPVFLEPSHHACLTWETGGHCLSLCLCLSETRFCPLTAHSAQETLQADQPVLR